jgi:Leucine-rich repeat (LRR) protein
MGLEKLDLSDNVLSSMQEVKRIRKLPLLSQLWLQGNPISYLEIYRKQTLLYFLSEVR